MVIEMIRLQNHIGKIDISTEYFESLVSDAVVSCFGVAAMSEVDAAQGLLNKLRRHPSNRGVKIKYQKSKLIIELHIIVNYGTNISAIVKSIIHKVRYVVEEATGISVARVNVFVDSMTVK
ncbi:MAG: Asp23/Gls24 family envelope stress response protein [Clostridiales bacterium]|nr:Asp23/Gls24 family envelope stress response protein [Clostridiales bacterium]